MTYQSPISPGRSWYEDSVGERPVYPALDGDTTADVVIVGGGFTGLSAAVHLAKAGTDKTKLLSATIYITDMKTFPEMNAAWDGWVSAGNAPARATVEAKLAAPQYNVEIMVIAAK